MKVQYLWSVNVYLLIPVAERSKARVCGRSFDKISGLTPAGGMDVSPVWLLCVVRLHVSATGRSLVQRSLTDYTILLCGLEASRMRGSWSALGCCVSAEYTHCAVVCWLLRHWLFLTQVVLEASVGSTGMSDIAVDDVTFVQGPCPGMLHINHTSFLGTLHTDCVGSI